MGDLDSNIANGTCYYAYNEAAGDELVPCGNGGIDHVSCCFGGDYCDADNTCYDESSEFISGASSTLSDQGHPDLLLQPATPTSRAAQTRSIPTAHALGSRTTLTSKNGSA